MVHVAYIVIFVVSIVDGIPLLGPCSLLLKIESSRRLIDFIIVFGRSCMTYETKHITFSCHTCESEQRLLMFKNFLMNVTIEGAHWEKFVQGLDLVQNMWKAQSNVIKGRALYQPVVLKPPKLSNTSGEREVGRFQYMHYCPLEATPERDRD